MFSNNSEAIGTSITKTNPSGDGCADVRCAKHGFLARVIVNVAEVFCNKCGRWIRAVPDKERRKVEMRQARNQRYYKSRQSSAIQTIQQVAI